MNYINIQTQVNEINEETRNKNGLLEKRQCLRRDETADQNFSAITRPRPTRIQLPVVLLVVDVSFV